MTHVDAKSALASVQTALREMPPSHPAIALEDIYASDPDNTLRVKGDAESVGTVRQILSQLDFAPRLVRLQVQYIETTRDDLKRLGIDLPMSPIFAQGLLTPSRKDTSKLLTALKDGTLKVTHGPQIMTANNMPATIAVSQRIRAGQRTQNSLETGTSVTANPHVNSDDSITLDLTVEDTALNSGVAASDGGPATGTRRLKTLHTLANGEATYIGGLPRFGSTLLLVFATATLLPGQQTAAAPQSP